MIHYLSLGEIAELLGVSVNSIKGYHLKGMLPPPDARVGRNQGWLESTILEWNANRPHANA